MMTVLSVIQYEGVQEIVDLNTGERTPFPLAFHLILAPDADEELASEAAKAISLCIARGLVSGNIFRDE